MRQSYMTNSRLYFLMRNVAASDKIRINFQWCHENSTSKAVKGNKKKKDSNIALKETYIYMNI